MLRFNNQLKSLKLKKALENNRRDIQSVDALFNDEPKPTKLTIHYGSWNELNRTGDSDLGTKDISLLAKHLKAYDPDGEKALEIALKYRKS